MKIWFLDDDRIELAAWQRTTKTFTTWDVKLFTDFTIFKDAFKEEIPDVAVIDLVMPLYPGVEVLRWMVANHPAVKLFVCTGMAGAQYEILANSFGATYLDKIRTFPDRLEEIEHGC